MQASLFSQRGQVTAEWLVGTLILVLALFVPLNGEDSAVSLMMTAIRDHYSAASFVASMP
ncbi:hypothetical protein [Allohahella sp. A8]|uniref:hypothetical protein n=1 Tax=Allohahella sp. A8 TaxID=3141461 RepID=UPI003A7FCBE3